MNKETIVEHRETLKALANRDDLHSAEIAEALLEIADSSEPGV